MIVALVSKNLLVNQGLIHTNTITLKNAAQYGDMNKKSKHCGRKVLITGPTGKKATATINDACPGCKKSKLLLGKQVI